MGFSVFNPQKRPVISRYDVTTMVRIKPDGKKTIKRNLTALGRCEIPGRRWDTEGVDIDKADRVCWRFVLVEAVNLIKHWEELITPGRRSLFFLAFIELLS